MAQAPGAKTDRIHTYGRNWYWLGFGALGGAALLIAAMAFFSLRTLGHAKDTVLREYARYVVHSQQAQLLTEQQLAHSRGFLLTGDTLFLGRWNRSRQEIAALWDTLERMAPSPRERAMVQGIRGIEARHEEASRALISRAGIRPDPEILLRIFQDELQPSRDSVEMLSTAFVDHGLDLLADAEEDAGRTAGLAMAAVGVTTVFCLLLSLILALRVTRRLADSQRTLRISQARLDAVVSSAMDGIITIDEGQRIVLFNRAAERIFRLPVWEALGQPLERFIPQRYRKDHASHVRRFGETGVTSRSMGQLNRLFGLRADGEEFPLEATISQTEVGGETLYTVILRDITERIRAEEALKESEAKLRQSQKMEAIGQLAGGVAHDFNNLLTAINGYCELTLAEVDKDSPLRENLLEIRKAGERAATLTSQLLAYSRKQVVAPRVLNLNQVVGNIGKMLQRLIGDNMSLITRLEPELDLVRIDGGQVEQVLVNLVLNARDAMPRGGPIEVRTRNADLGPDSQGMVLEAEPGRYVCVEVADKGTGMTPEVQARIFEPFFTTKTVGKGTGLGLSSVYGILKQAGGAMKVASVMGRGSTFSLFFPALPAETRLKPENEGTAGLVHGGSGETLLLAEDEAAVRHFTRKTLESHGYRVLEGRDGDDAYRRFKEHGSGVSLLITDLVMPGMNGRELAEKVREERPELHVLFMSGYTEETLDVAELQRHGDLFLPKPFSPDQLLQRVHEILARSLAGRV
jgi:PAS domain S-box-containing protein